MITENTDLLRVVFPDHLSLAQTTKIQTGIERLMNACQINSKGQRQQLMVSRVVATKKSLQ